MEMRTTVPEERTGEMSVSVKHCVRGGRAMLVSRRGGKKYSWEISIAQAWNPPYQIMNTWNIKQDRVQGNVPFTRYSTNTTKPGGEERDKPGGEDVTSQSDRRGDGIDTGSVESFRKTEVSSLISEWESRARGGEERDMLELPEENDFGRGRRVRQEFQQVRRRGESDQQ
jgi:hypothetical protein